MRINNNIMALNAHRQLGANQAAGAKSMERLSSGLRINRAGDDAAGLAISEKMRGQIRGLKQASRNAQNGISLIQTAEGNLNETHAILQRMRELAVQASNDTNDNQVDRAAIQGEIEQLKTEIDRIGNTTEFNTQKLLDGSIGAKKAPGVDNAAVMTSGLAKETAASTTGSAAFNGVSNGAISDLTDNLTGQTITVDGATIKFDVSEAELDAVAYDTTGAEFASLLQDKINSAIDEYNNLYDANVAHVSVTADSGSITIESGSTGGTSSIQFTAGEAGEDLVDIWNIAGYNNTAVTISGSEGVFTAAGLGAVNSIAETDKSTVTVDGIELEVTWSTVGDGSYTEDQMEALAADIATDINAAIANYNSGVPAENRLENVTAFVKDGSVVIQSGSDKAASSVKFDKSEATQALGLAGESSATQGGGIKFQIGANQGQNMQITIADMRADALGITDVDLSTREGADAAIATIEAAITKVSTQRSELGAFQNRLEHTISNLGTSAENLQAAESRIRDLDMAEEIMAFTKNNILQQAATAMLAQANMAPQSVLQLLG